MREAKRLIPLRGAEVLRFAQDDTGLLCDLCLSATSAMKAFAVALQLERNEMEKIGLIVGREWSFPPAFIEEIAKRDAGVEAEFVKLGGTAMDEPVPYSVIIDRISHEVPYYRTYLKPAALQGTTVVNNPFMWSADDKMFGASLATKLGGASPKAIALPNRE